MHALADEDGAIPTSSVSKDVAQGRMLVGLLQGLALYFLYLSLKNGTGPATNAYFFAPLLLISLLVPVLFVSGLGHLETRRMWIWMFAATGIAAVLGVYDIWRQGYLEQNWFGIAAGMSRATPSALVLCFAAIGFYIAHALVLAAAADQRRIARYPSYFERAWKLIIQIIFSMLFVGILWLILWLGAALFMLVKLNFLYELLLKTWFSIPVTAFAFSTALHITDVRPGIVRGIRSLLLVLMSWLLPVTTLIVCGFLLSLPFAGLEPLWATRHATSVLLGTAAVLVLLINATFQGGEVGEDVARVLRGSARLACVLLLPIVAIAIYSLTLRVAQYGWTTDRIIAAACLLIAACYASGYLWAALERKGWLERIAPINVLTAFVILAVLLALFTPIADPARLSVADQLARLESGKVDAEKFDFHYLRFEGARYGNDALQKLKTTTTGVDAALLNKRAEAALQKKNKWDRGSTPLVADARARAANITVWPNSKVLPPAFIEQNWTEFEKNYQFPPCLKQQDSKCNAYLIDLNGDGKTEILIKNVEIYGPAVAFSLATDGKWQPSGTVNGINPNCKELLQALAEDSYQLVVPLFKDLQVAGRRMRVDPWSSDPNKCASTGK